MTEETDTGPAGSPSFWRRLSDLELLGLAERLADAVRRLRGLEPPIDVARWCAAAGVAVEWVRTFEEGKYLRTCLRATVQLRRGITRSRQHFVVAHELGHHFLEEVRREPDLRRGLAGPALRWLGRVPVGGGDEERLCDAFAGALLLPTDDVLDVGRTQGYTLRAVRSLAARYEVSEETVAVRVAQLADVSLRYLACSPDGDGWRVERCAGDRDRGGLIQLAVGAPLRGATDGWWVDREVVRRVRLDVDHRADGSMVAVVRSAGPVPRPGRQPGDRRGPAPPGGGRPAASR